MLTGSSFDDAWCSELTNWRDAVRWRPNSSARYLKYGLGLGVNLADGEEIVGVTMRASGGGHAELARV